MTNTHLLHIADRVLDQPLLITPAKARTILNVLAGRIGVNSPEASRFEGDDTLYDENGRPVRGDWGERKRKPYRVSNGVGIITITGSLVARGAWIGSYSGLTSYEGIQHQLKSAEADPSVHSAIIDMHTPGGEAVLAFETAALVRQLAAKKRTVAIVNGMACSAGYAIASGATEIVTTETGVSGSIGVVLLHGDFSRQLDRDGITPTLIHAGAHKVDGNPFEPLTEEVRADLQAEVNAFYDAFLATVEKGRDKRLDAAAARATEARTFIGKQAVEVGVADRVGTFESVLAELTRAAGRSTVQNGSTSMDTTAASPDALAERERFKAVMNSDHYSGRETSAHHMLFNTDMAAEAIVGVLAGVAATLAVPAGQRAATSPLGLVVGSEVGKYPSASNNHGWDEVVAEINKTVSA